MRPQMPVLCHQPGQQNDKAPTCGLIWAVLMQQVIADPLNDAAHLYNGTLDQG